MKEDYKEMKTSKEVALTVAGIVALLTTGQTMVQAASTASDNQSSDSEVAVSIDDMVSASASSNKITFKKQNIRVTSNTSVSSDKIVDATKSNADKAAEKAAKAAKETVNKQEAKEKAAKVAKEKAAKAAKAAQEQANKDAEKAAKAAQEQAKKDAEKAAKAAQEQAKKDAEAAKVAQEQANKDAEVAAKAAQEQAKKDAEAAAKASAEEAQAAATSAPEAEPQTVSTAAPAAAPAAPKAAPAPAGSGSVYDQFIAAGGTPAMWRTIVLPESGGNPNVVSPNGYRGLGQTKEGWGTGSVAQQTKGMLGYASSRYGSVDGALKFRNANGWW